MRKFAIEMLVLSVSTFSMLFAGYQSLLFRQSMAMPFEANLQSREIDVCGALIRQSQIFFSNVVSPFASFDLEQFFKNVEVPKGTGLVSPELKWDAPSTKMIFFNSVLTSNSKAIRDLVGALAELKVYSSDATLPLIDKAIGTVQMMELKTWTDLDSKVKKAGDEGSVALEPLQKRCKAIMLGQEKGML